MSEMYDRLMADMKTAMKEHDMMAVNAIRGVIAKAKGPHCERRATNSKPRRCGVSCFWNQGSSPISANTACTVRSMRTFVWLTRLREMQKRAATSSMGMFSSTYAR